MFTDNEGASFVGALNDALQYVKEASGFLTDMYNCLPPGMQSVLMMLFVLIFGFGTIMALLSILK